MITNTGAAAATASELIHQNVDLQVNIQIQYSYYNSFQLNHIQNICSGTFPRRQIRSSIFCKPKDG